MAWLPFPGLTVTRFYGWPGKMPLGGNVTAGIIFQEVKREDGRGAHLKRQELCWRARRLHLNLFLSRARGNK